MQRKIFWLSFLIVGTIAEVVLPFGWGLLATIPIVFACWWFAYRSGWFPTD